MRINKYLAEQKVASRREADALIESGKVLINGKKATLGQQVAKGDTVELIGKPKKHTYLAYYKGRGVITHSPAEHEIDIATRLKKDYGITGVNPIGRLDKNSEGLMILTDDGRLTGPLLDTEANHEKEYDVTVDKPVTGMFTKLMETGVDIEGYKTKPAKTKANPKNNKRFKLTITEGKKHQIRRMCAALGFQVQNLKRVRIMNIELGSLKPNQYRKIGGEELQVLLKSLEL
ncbi:MAG: rRNA pseudouridine synthase [Candidatus Nomurabacteria bacterium]|nr:MAG: rRNA pseudouridine synthase [Candidatus Nomurabacteria bacterium]